MSGSMEKALAILEYLAARPHGASLVSVATDLNQIRSGCHRTLNELVKYGYVRPLPQRGEYVLTTKLSSMGMSFLSVHPGTSSVFGVGCDFLGVVRSGGSR